MQIIPAVLEDSKEIRQIAEKSWAATYHEILSVDQISYMLMLMYSDEALDAHFKNPDYHYFFLDYNGKKNGFFGFEHHVEPQTTKLHRIYLLPEAQGKGAGRFAVDFIKTHALRAGDHRIILTVNKNNKAREAYEKLGFHLYGDGIFDIGNGYVMNDFLMEMLL